MLTTVLAQSDISLSPTGQFTGLSDITINSIVQALVTLVMITGALVFFFFLVMGGVKYISSGGDKLQTQAARSQITAAMIGLTIVLGAWAIISLVSTFFGVDLYNLNIPNAQAP
jgi:hypothetical protein